VVPHVVEHETHQELYKISLVTPKDYFDSIDPIQTLPGLGAFIRPFDWSTTSLGPIAGWPLKGAVSLVLAPPSILHRLIRTGYFLYQSSPSLISLISVKGFAQAIGQKVTL
jgi:hypothetical protein